MQFILIFKCHTRATSAIKFLGVSDSGIASSAFVKRVWVSIIPRLFQFQAFDGEETANRNAYNTNQEDNAEPKPIISFGVGNETEELISLGLSENTITLEEYERNELTVLIVVPQINK